MAAWTNSKNFRPLYPGYLLCLALGTTSLNAQTIDRVRPNDMYLDCYAIANEQAAIRPLIEAGKAGPNMGNTVAGAAANVGAQAAIGQMASGLFGAFGGMGNRMAASAAQTAAQTAAQSAMAPDAATIERASQAGARDAFLVRLAAVKNCAAGGPGQAVSMEMFHQLAGAPAGGNPMGSNMPPATSGASNNQAMRQGDMYLDCYAIANEQATLRPVIDAGKTGPTMGSAAAGAAANVGAQAAIGQMASGFFGAFGGMASRMAGAAAQATVESTIAPDAATVERAAQASAREAFLIRLAGAKNCSAGGPGQALSNDAFMQLAAIPAGGVMAITPLSVASIQSVLSEPITPLPTEGVLQGKVETRGKTIYLTEFRVLFDVGGEVTGSTRGGYLLGTDYGSTRASVKYTVPRLDIAAFQLITDRAFTDFMSRMARARVNVVYDPPEGGGVYNATEDASMPGRPVYLDKSTGHGKRRMLVMAPAGMKLISRGMAGIGAGDIGKRIDWARRGWDGMSVTQTVNIAELESSGSGSSILRRGGSSADVSSQLTIGNSVEDYVIQTHVSGGLVRMGQGVEVPGTFANFRTVSSYDSDKDTTMRAIGMMQNYMGQAANKTRQVEKEVDLDGPALARLSLRGLATVNQAMADLLRGGQ